ncbi:MAG: hypothetical protein DWQ04_15205 [Chloroflexi bacterium]|nr:MAG: hypothetical protein DWQ04_15205 [Chloroflexota bacterium]
MNWLDRILLLATGLAAIYIIWRLYGRYTQKKALHDVYYLGGFVVLLVSGLLLIFLGWGILASPYVLTVATLIPLGISMGLMNQFLPEYKKYYSWFALAGLLAIAVTSIGGMPLKKLAVPLFHGVAGMIIFLLPIKLSMDKKVPAGFWWVGIGGMLIGIGGIALAFVVSGSQLLFLSHEVILTILAPILLLMTLAYTWGFDKDVQAG